MNVSPSLEQAENFEYTFWVQDPENDDLTVTYELFESDGTTQATLKPISVQLIPGEVPNYKWVYDQSIFTPKMPTTSAATHVYKLVLTVSDDSVSTLAANTYTITMTIHNTNHAPYYTGSLELTGWTVGVAPTFPVISATDFTDDDGNSLTFDSTNKCEV